MSLSETLSRSVPLYSTSPSKRAFTPRVSPISVIAVTLLPEPDSPTIPSTLPRSSFREMPSTARTIPSSVANWTLRSLTSSRVSGIGLSEPDPRVQIRVGDVDERREDDDERRAVKRHAHQRRQVLLVDRLGRVVADPVDRVDRLGDDRPTAEHGGEVEPEQRHDRNERGAQRVLDEDLARRQPLCLGRPHEVLVDRVEDVRTQNPTVEADEEDGEREPRQQQVVEPLPRVRGQGDVAAVGEPRHGPALPGEEVAEKEPQPGDWERDADQGECGDGTIRGAAGGDGGDRPHQHTEAEPDDPGADAERERLRHSFLDLLDDVRPVVVRDEAAAEQLLHHVPPLYEDVLVEPELQPDVRDVLRRSLLAGNTPRHVAARDLEKDEVCDEADGEQDDDHPERPADEERNHLVLDPHLRPWIERVAQSVAEDVEREDRDGDHDSREQAEPRVAREHVLTVRDHRPPRGMRRLHAGAEEREPDLGEDRIRDDQREQHDDRGGDIGEQLREHDSQRARSLRGRGLDELAVAQRKDLPSQRSPDVGDEHECDDAYRDPEAAGGDVERPAGEDPETGDDRVVEAIDRKCGTERDPEQDDREGPDQVEEPRDDPVRSAAEVGGEQREDDGQDGGDRGRGEADHERGAAAVEKAGAHVAAE